MRSHRAREPSFDEVRRGCESHDDDDDDDDDDDEQEEEVDPEINWVVLTHPLCAFHDSKGGHTSLSSSSSSPLSSPSALPPSFLTSDPLIRSWDDDEVVGRSTPNTATRPPCPPALNNILFVDFFEDGEREEAEEAEEEKEEEEKEEEELNDRV